MLVNRLWTVAHRQWRSTLFLALVLLFTGVAGWSMTCDTEQTIIASRAGPGHVYLALGDSLAVGLTVQHPDEAYVMRIVQALQHHQPIEVRNIAVPGETTVSMLQRQLPQALAIIHMERAGGRRVSPITIDIGGNDAIAAKRDAAADWQQAIAMIEANIAKILDALIVATTTSAEQRSADIVIMTYYNPFPGDETDTDDFTYWNAQLNSAIKRVAHNRSVAVADIASPFAGDNVYRYTNIATGDIHANTEGHALIAEAFLEALGYDE